MLFAIVFFHLGVQAQEVEKDSNKVFFIKKYYLKRKAKAFANAEKYETYRVSGLSFGNAAVQDTRMAPAVYRGATIGGNLSWREFSENWYNEVNLEFAYTNPSFEGGSSSTYNNFRMQSNVTYLKKFNEQSSFFLGGAIHFVDGLRIYPYLGNSSFNNDLTVSINPELRYQKEIGFIGRSYTVYSNFSINAFSFVNRTPSFSISLDGAKSYWAPIGQFNRARIVTSIHSKRKFSNENRIGLEYSWDFYSMNENNGYVKLRSAQHLVSLNYWFKTR